MNRVGAIELLGPAEYLGQVVPGRGSTRLRAVGSNAATHPPGWVSRTISIGRM